MNFPRDNTTADHLRCQDFKAEMSAYLDDELARDATARLADSTEEPLEWSRLQEDVSMGALDKSVDALSDVE